MRFEGSIKAWYDDRGFGFIVPDQGGQEIFVHVNSFDARFGRPQIGRRVSFEVELNRDGKKRAKKVDALRERRVRPVRRGGGPAPWGTASLFALPLFATGFVLAAIFWRVPAWIALLYAVASVVCFIAYAMDKSAAQSGGWRTSEQTLLLRGLVGAGPAPSWRSNSSGTSPARRPSAPPSGGRWC